MMAERSYIKIALTDLSGLGRIARRDREDLFRRKPDLRRIYSGRLFAVALCQGAALHYVNGKTGIKDLDVWSFYRAAPERPYPYRRRGISDFGDAKFGKSDDCPHFVGRRVDLLGRSIEVTETADPVSALRSYLSAGKTESARLLAQKAVVLIEPEALTGTVVWPYQGIGIPWDSG